jgi:hypothetical protein
MEKTRDMTFEEWLREVRKFLVEAGYSPDPEDARQCGSDEGWREYFENGYAPREAVKEDFSYA